MIKPNNTVALWFDKHRQLRFVAMLFGMVVAIAIAIVTAGWQLIRFIGIGLSEGVRDGWSVATNIVRDNAVVWGRAIEYAFNNLEQDDER